MDKKQKRKIVGVVIISGVILVSVTTAGTLRMRRREKAEQEIEENNNYITATQTLRNSDTEGTNNVIGSWDISENGDGSIIATIDDEGNMTITGSGKMKYYGNVSDVPYDDVKSTIKTVTISSGIEDIGRYAFYGCDNLTNISIPNSVINIGNGAFYDCTSLTSVELPNGVKTIGWNSFDGCINLTSIEIPNSVTNIGIGAFKMCSNLRSVIIPNSVISIGDEAFHLCTSLTRIYILSPGVTYSGNKIFNGNAKLYGYEGSTTEIEASSLGYDFEKLYTLEMSENGNGEDTSKQSTVATITNNAQDVISITNSEYAWSTSNTEEPTYSSTFTSGDTIEKTSSTETQYLWIKLTDSAGNTQSYVSNVFNGEQIQEEVINVTGVTLNKETEELKVGGTVSLVATVAPENATNKNVIWSSDNAEIATVNNGIVTAVGEGTATITVTTEDGSKTAICTVTVTTEDIEDSQGPEIHIEKGFTNNSEYLVTITATDTSGVSNIKWKKENGADKATAGDECIIVPNENGKYIVTVEDTKGNITTEEIEITELKEESTAEMKEMEDGTYRVYVTPRTNQLVKTIMVQGQNIIENEDNGSYWFIPEKDGNYSIEITYEDDQGELTNPESKTFEATGISGGSSEGGSSEGGSSEGGSSEGGSSEGGSSEGGSSEGGSSEGGSSEGGSSEGGSSEGGSSEGGSSEGGSSEEGSNQNGSNSGEVSNGGSSNVGSSSGTQTKSVDTDTTTAKAEETTALTTLPYTGKGIGAIIATIGSVLTAIFTWFKSRREK